MKVEPRFRPDTAYLSLEQLSSTPASIRQYLVLPDDLPADAIVILDLADAPYEFLNEGFLHQLATMVQEFADGNSRSFIILLPRNPESSALWPGLERAAGDGPTRIVVLDDRADIRLFGLQRRGRFKPLRDQWPGRRTQITGSAAERFRDRIVARVGHFALVADPGLSADARICGRYHHDYSLGVAELVELVHGWLLATFTEKQLADATLVLCGGCSDMLINAVMVAAKRVGAEWREVPEPDAFASDGSSCHILLFDVIGTGATLRAFRRDTPSWSVPVAKRAFAVLATEDAPLSGTIRVDVLARVTQEATPASECERCAKQVPFTDPSLPDPQLSIATEDLWWMLDQVAWGPEDYGPAELPKYPLIPDFAEVFGRWGDWIAYKYSFLLKELGETNTLVVICPQERAVLGLVEQLSRRFSDQLVAVAIPRTLLNEIGRRPERAEEVAREHGAENEWRRQLQALGRNGDAVLVIDEFNSSGSTARGVTHLVRTFGAEVAAYLPFLDWGRHSPIATLAAKSLYSFPNPRPAK